MGLLLSILVTCVGVLEVIACVRHFQNGYLPLWTPHLVSSATTNLYEHWRTIPNYYCHGREVYPEHANILTNKIDTVEQNELFDNSFLEHCEKSDCEINVISYCTNADTSVQNTASVLQTESVKNDKFGDNDYKIHNFDSKDLRFVSSLNPELNIQEKHDSVESLYLAPEFNTDSVTSFDTSIFSEGDRILKNDTPSQFSKKDTFLKSLLHDCDFRENVKNQDAPEKTYDSFSQSLTENVPWVQDFSADNALLPLTTESKDIEFSSGVSQGVPEKIYEVVSNSLSQAKACVQDLNAKNIHLPLTSGSKEIELPLKIYLDVPEKSDEFLSRSLSQKESETCVKNYNADDVNLSLTTESNEFPSDTCLDVPGKTYEDVSHSFPQNGSETCAQNFNADNVHLILVTSNKEIEFPSVTSQNVPENSNECVRHSLLQNESEICVQNSDAADIHLSLSTESNKVEFPSVTCQDVPEKSNESVRYSLSQNESEICVKNSDAAGIHLSLSTESNEIEFPSVTCQDVHEKSNECVRHSLLQNESESFVQNSDDGNIHLSLSAESNEIEFPSVTCQDVPEKSNESVRYSLSQKESEICVQNSNPDNIHLSLSRGSNEIEFQLLTCQDLPEKSNEPVKCSLSQNERESFVQNSDDGNVHLPLTTESKEIEFLSETPEDVPEETVDAVNHSLSQTGSETCVQNFNADNIHLSLTTETKEIEFLSHVPEKPKKIDSCSLLQTEPCAADNNVDNTTDGKEIKIQSETHTYNVQKSEADNKDEKSDVHNQESALICNQLVSSASDDCNDQLVSSASDESLLSFQTNEFSKKEMALKRKRSYKSKKNNASMTDGRKSRILPASSTLEERNCVSREDANVGISSEIISSKSLSEITQNTANIWADVPFNSFETTDNEHSVDKSLNSFSVSQDKDDKDNKLCESTSGCVSLSQETEKHAAKCSEAEERSNCESSKEAFWLIFSGEYTKALSKDWHSGHFCCWQCDESLTGQRYVLRDEHPYCIKCYESVFANVCEECNKIIGIDSKDLSYKDKHWHEACFLCNKCHVSLVDKQFGSKADKIYCGNCYDTQFASRCDGCGDIFRAGTKKMEYKTRQWHEKCFCCCVCKTAIGTKSFIPREQEIYCATCYEEKFATRCVKCNKIITSGGVTYKNEPWHRECFTCTHCNTSLAGQRFTSRDEKPYCAECFGELFAKRCTSCSKPITGIGGTRFISFEDRHWHNDCFICASCKTSLVGRGFITDGDDIICPECAKQKLM